MIRPPFGLLLLVLLLLPTAPMAAPVSGVVVSLEPLATASASDPAQLASELARLTAALEVPEGDAPPVKVVHGYVRPATVLGDSGDATELLAGAAQAGASHLIRAGLTELAGAYSLDLAAFDVPNGDRVYHGQFEAADRAALGTAFQHGAVALRAALELGATAPAVAAGGAKLAQGDVAVEAEALLGPAARGAARAPQDVVEVRIEGNRRIESDAIRAVLGTEPGAPLRQGQVARDIRRIYELGFFRDVRVVSDDAQGGIIVTFIVEENPIIRQVSVSGNDSMGGDEIKDILTLTVGSTIDYPLLFENRRRIEALYQAAGFYLAKVSYTVEPIGEAAVAVDFGIDEGKKLRLTAVDFEGNEHLSSKHLRSLMDTKPWGLTSYVTHFWNHAGLYNEPIFHQDLNRIRNAYMDDGFIRVLVGKPDVQVSEEGLRVVVDIDEGDQYQVGEVDLVGDESIDTEELWSLVDMAPGNTFDRSLLASDVEQLRDFYADQGYYFAKVTPRTRVDPEELTVDCVFDVEKGDLFFVDRIQVRGNTRTRDPVVRRELGVAEGGLYSGSAIKRSRERLQRLGFFEEVEIESKPQPDGEEGQLALDVEVVERRTGSFSFGAGFGSSDGFVINAALQEENLFGKGYGLTLSVDLGDDRSGGYLRFVDPYFMDSAVSMSVVSYMNQVDYTDYERDSKGFEFSLGYPLDEGETRASTAYSYDLEKATPDSVNATSLLQREEFDGESDTSMLTLSLVRDTRDDLRFPKSGYVSGASLNFAGLGAQNKFARMEVRHTWYRPVDKLLGFESTFVVNSRIGYTHPLNTIGDWDLPGCVGCTNLGPEVQPLTNIDTDLELPLTERYFLGGIGAFQMRGFDQYSLGPRRSLIYAAGSGVNKSFTTIGRSQFDGSCTVSVCNSINDRDIDDFEDLNDTDIIGGNKMFLTNFELRFPVSEELGLSGIVFLDMGNAFAENESINPGDFRFSTGVGAQWFSPFGPVVAYLGFPLDPLEDEDPSVFEFSLGGGGY